MAIVSRYPAYRPSDLPWVPQLPERWQVLRNGRLFAHRVETGFPELPILEVSLRTGVRVRDMENLKRKQMMSQKEKYKRAVKDDLAYNMMRMWQGAVGPVPVDGLVSPAYVVVRPYPEAKSEYFSYLFRTAAYMQEVNKFSRGIVADRNRLYWESFKQMPSIVPPRPEQDRIVAYLRAQDAQVARFIKNKRALIALLNEQKLHIIDRVVTKGLDADVQLKRSSIDWLGEVPQHWQITRIKNLAADSPRSFVDGDWIEAPYITDHGVRLIQTGNVGIGKYKEQGWRYISSETFEELRCTEISPGDILICRLGDPVARACLAPDLGCRMITSVDVCILKPAADVHPQYVVHALSSPRFLHWVSSLVRGSTRDRVSRSMLGAFALVLPPKDEQQAICSWIVDTCRPLDEAITRAEDEIKLIREYRDGLVADAVTGQIDVRGWRPGPDDVVSEENLSLLRDDEAGDADEEEGDDED
jgi:type I restriction enzyme S subunit